MTNPYAVKLLIADDHTMVLEMIQLALAASKDIDLHLAADFDSALAKVVQDGDFDLVLLDVDMPGMQGAEGLTIMQAAIPKGRVGLITGDPNPNIVSAAQRLGAAGVVSKRGSMRSLTNAVRFMAAGERYFPLELIIEQETQRPATSIPLTEREFTVLRKLSEGLPNRDISEALGLSEPTVKMHIKSIYKKLGVGNRTQAVISARDLKLV